MCNAYNHSPHCNCGWGGESYFGFYNSDSSCNTPKYATKGWVSDIFTEQITFKTSCRISLGLLRFGLVACQSAISAAGWVKRSKPQQKLANPHELVMLGLAFARPNLRNRLLRHPPSAAADLGLRDQYIV